MGKRRVVKGRPMGLLPVVALIVTTLSGCSANPKSEAAIAMGAAPVQLEEVNSAPVKELEVPSLSESAQVETTSDLLTLVAEGKTDYVILLPDAPAPAVATAGRELAEYLLKITGAMFPTLTESELAAKVEGGASFPPVLALGPSQFVDRLLLEKEIDLGEAYEDSIYLHTEGENVILTGSSERAVLYAAYTFLEDVCGVRWWTSKVEFVPSDANLKVPHLDRLYAPRIKYRDIYYADARTNPFSARLKLNGHMQPIGREQGGHYRIIGLCHTFGQFLPGHVYFEEHPEWYSLRNGKRLKEDGQLCLTNDEMREEFTRVALERIRKDPEAGYIGVSQDDNRNSCQCPNCRQVVAEEGAESGAILRFVNAVAEDIEKEYPDFKIVTLAYQYTEKPPRITKPRENVLVQLCSIEASFAEPLLSGPQNQSFSKNLNDWLAITPRLFIWDYLTNFSKSLVPFPNYRVMGQNIHDLSHSDVVGMFCQGDSLSVTGDFLHMRAWVVSHMLWNPDADADALRREFLDGYFGAAGKYLEDYLMYMSDRVEASGSVLKCDRGDTSTWLTMEELNVATKFFDQAEEAVEGDPALTTRLEIARITLDNAWLEYLKRSPEAPITQSADYLGPKDLKAAIEDFLVVTEKYGTRHYSESEKFSFYRDRLKMWQSTLGRKPAPLPEALPAADEVQVIGPWDIRMFAAGRWTELVEEESAPYGGAVKLLGKFHQWAVQYRFPESLSGEWELYAEVRCDAMEGYEGTGMSIGIHDGLAKRNTLDVKVPAAEITGDGYSLVKIGTANLNPECFFFMAPAGKPEQPAPDLYMGRILLIKPSDLAAAVDTTDAVDVTDVTDVAE